MEYGYFDIIPVLIAATVLVTGILLSLRLPSILGYLVVGIVLGPFGVGFVQNMDHIRVIAEFGVVFLLFSIGLEFSLPLLLRMKGAVLGLGGFQVLLTTAATVIIAVYLGMSLESAIVVGGVVAMSSTALVTSQLSDQVELHSWHGLNAVGVLLFQDVMVVPFLIIVAGLIESTASTPLLSLAKALSEGLVALFIIFIVGRWGLRPLFRQIARFRSAELFTLTTLLVILGAAWITHHLGLSMALGAFVAGMMLGETEFRHQLEVEIRPFRDVLLGLFFITVGMLLNIGLLADAWQWVVLLLSGLVLFKLLLVTGLCRIAGWDIAVSLRTGLVLAHGGEFGFAILTLAMSGNVLPPDYGQVILAALIVSMGIAPILIRYNQQLVSFLLPKASRESLETIRENIADRAQDMANHVIICGYGRVGQVVARFVEEEGLNYLAMDTDPFRVKNAVEAKAPVTYGDAANIELLKAAGLARAAALAFCIDNIDEVIKVLPQLRELNPDLPILVRTADDSRLEELQQAGATEVVPETMEASLMISSHLLFLLEVPVDRVMDRIRRVRNNRYALLRRLFPGESGIIKGELDKKEQLRAVEFPSDGSATPRTIGECDLDELGIAVASVLRGDTRITDPDSEFPLQPGDTLILSGNPAALEQAGSALRRL